MSEVPVVHFSVHPEQFLSLFKYITQCVVQNVLTSIRKVDYSYKPLAPRDRKDIREIQPWKRKYLTRSSAGRCRRYPSCRSGAPSPGWEALSRKPRAARVRRCRPLWLAWCPGGVSGLGLSGDIGIAGPQPRGHPQTARRRERPAALRWDGFVVVGVCRRRRARALAPCGGWPRRPRRRGEGWLLGVG